jgi:hypothetical protein
VSAFSGYVAAMEWSRVQVERPSSSTSGGQSVGILLEGGAAGEAAVLAEVVILPGLLCVEDDTAVEYCELVVFTCFVRTHCFERLKTD